MNKQGFTLIELLTVVLILGILVSIALPKYTRTIERARATEAMNNVKVLNDAVYAYAAGRSGETACPISFKKLSISLPGTYNADATTLTTRDFVYTINAATGADIPGTDCHGVTAQRIGGAKYDYTIWNPFQIGTSGQGASLACTSEVETSRAVCESLDLYTEGASPFVSMD